MGNDTRTIADRDVQIALLELELVRKNAAIKNLVEAFNMTTTMLTNGASIEDVTVAVDNMRIAAAKDEADAG